MEISDEKIKEFLKVHLEKLGLDEIEIIIKEH